MIKTTAKNEINVYEYLLDVQPYDTPEIISLPIQNGSQAFLNWIHDSVKS
jgi:periplasmic divalent cation tolerance protein